MPSASTKLPIGQATEGCNQRTGYPNIDAVLGIGRESESLNASVFCKKWRTWLAIIGVVSVSGNAITAAGALRSRSVLSQRYTMGEANFCGKRRRVQISETSFLAPFAGELRKRRVFIEGPDSADRLLCRPFRGPVGYRSAYCGRHRCVLALNGAPEDFIQLEIIDLVIIAEVHLGGTRGAVGGLGIHRL